MKRWRGVLCYEEISLSLFMSICASTRDATYPSSGHLVGHLWRTTSLEIKVLLGKNMFSIEIMLRGLSSTVVPITMPLCYLVLSVLRNPEEVKYHI